jgi:hypothetical protein
MSPDTSSADTTFPNSPSATLAPVGRGLLSRWRRHEQLRRERQREQRRGQLDALQIVLSEARQLVETRWIQDAWFEYIDVDGTSRLASGGWASRIPTVDVTGACLVGAIVMAGGGPQAAQTQLVQRAIDVTWHALRAEESDPVRWCPDPASRMSNIRDLTRWNDNDERGADEVAGLLLTAERLVSRELVDA